MDNWQIIYSLAFTMLIASLLLLVYVRPIDVNATFSKHAAQSKSLSVSYALIFIVSMPLMGLYIYYYLVPNYSLNLLVAYLFLFAIITQIICTFLPEKGDKLQMYIHKLFAGTSALLIILTTLLLATGTTGLVAKAYSAGFIIMLITIFFAILSKAKYALILQSIYYLGFLLPTLLTALK